MSTTWDDATDGPATTETTDDPDDGASTDDESPTPGTQERDDPEATGDGADATAEAPSESTTHLSDVPDGCGCVEVWEHTSERREG